MVDISKSDHFSEWVILGIYVTEIYTVKLRKKGQGLIFSKGLDGGTCKRDT